MSLSIYDSPSITSGLYQDLYSTDSNQDSSILSIYQQNDISSGDSASLLELTRDTEAGATAKVSEGSITLTDSEGNKSLQISSDDSVAILEQGERGMVIQNQTTGEAVNFQLGEEVNVSGTGQFELMGSATSSLLDQSERLRLEPGESAELTNPGDGLRLNENNFNNEITFSDSGSSINVTGGSDQELTLSTDSGTSLAFNPGDDATVARTDSGIRFENQTTGETMTVESGEELFATGEAELEIGGQVEVEGGDQLNTTTDTLEATIENRTVTESVEVARGDTGSSSGFTQLQTYSNPETAQISLFGTVLTELI